MKHSEEREAPDVITNDAENATKVEPKEAPQHKREKFRRFRAYNTGTWNGPKRENKEVTHRRDNLHRYDALASSLDLTSHQKSRGRKLLDELNFGEIGLRVDAVIFGLCVLVVNDEIEENRYYPSEYGQSGDATFKRVAESIDLSLSDQVSVVEKVRKKVDF